MVVGVTLPRLAYLNGSPIIAAKKGQSLHTAFNLGALLVWCAIWPVAPVDLSPEQSHYHVNVSSQMVLQGDLRSWYQAEAPRCW